MNCIDVSSYQGNINWSKLPAEIKRVIIRATVKSGNNDYMAKKNFAGALSTGRIADAYRFSYALSMDESRKEFKRVLSLLDSIGVSKDKTTIWDDMEWSKQLSVLSRQQITDLVKAAADEVLSAGYGFGVYCNLDWYRNVLIPSQLPYDWWIARYPKNDNGYIKEALRPNIGEIIWQYSSKGKVPGIAGKVDMNDWRIAEASASGGIYVVSVADVATKTEAMIASGAIPSKIDRIVHKIAVSGTEIWCVSIADVANEMEAVEIAEFIQRTYHLNCNVHKCVVLK